MTKYYDRKNPFENTKHSVQDYKTEMTFRRFRPKSANVLVKDRKIYQDPSVNPHFIYNRAIYQEYRSSLGSRQRLDGSLIDESRGVQPDDSPDKTKLREESIEKNQEVQQKNQRTEDQQKKQEEKFLQKSSRDQQVEKNKAILENKGSENEPIQQKQVKKQSKRVLKRNQRPQSSYVLKKPCQCKCHEQAYQRPEMTKEETKQQNQDKVPQDTKSVKKETATLPTVREETKSLVLEKEIQVDGSESCRRLQQQKIGARQPPILVTSEYRRSFSPPQKFIEKAPIYQKIVDDKEVEQQFRKKSNTTYRADFSPPRSKKMYRTLQTVRPAGVCSILGMVTYN